MYSPTVSLCSAPEVLRSEAYDESADAFSFAATVVACFKRGRAYDHTESFDLKSVSGRSCLPRRPPASDL